MPRYVALLRAVNVGGTGKLSMADLKSLCVAAGFERIETYIASGNVVFDSRGAAAKVKSALEAALHGHTGKPVGVLLRTAAEMRAVQEANPFSNKPGNCTYAIFLDAKPPKGALDETRGVNDEQMRLGKREIYVYYPSGMGRSKLKIPTAAKGTARNMNTVATLAGMSAAK